MKLKLLALLMAGAFLLAGCASGADDQEDDQTSTSSSVTGDTVAPEANFGPHNDLPRERPADYEPSLASPPEWVSGEWWKFRLTSNLDGSVWENTRIVAGKETGDYLVAMPLDDFDDGVMVMHLPGFGLVDSQTLGFEAHDVKFDVLDFPLEEGKTWSTFFESTNNQMNMAVTEVNGNVAEITVTGAFSGTITYDADVGEIVKFDLPGYATYEILEHGFNYEGTVRVPHSHDLIFFHGRIAVLQGFSPTQQDLLTPNPMLPLEDIEISAQYDRVSFGIIFQDLLATGSTGGGLFQLDVTAPDGTAYTSQKLPTDGRGFAVEIFSNDDPLGTWQMTNIAAGAGVALLEGIGYVTFDVELPSGCVLETSKVHSHGGDCGGHVHGIE